MPRPARPWFRFYVEAVHDRKLRRLKPEHRWLFVACLAAARQSPEPGVLLIGEDDPMTIEDLADFAGMPVRSTTDGVNALLAAGVLAWESADTERIIVPAWNARQFESDDVTARTSKHRSKEQGRNVPTSFQGTAPETEAETETEEPSSTSTQEGPDPAGDDDRSSVAIPDEDAIAAEARRRLAVYKRTHPDGVVSDGRWLAKVEQNLVAEGWTPALKPVEPHNTVPDADPILAELRNHANEAVPPGDGLARVRQALHARTEAS